MLQLFIICALFLAKDALTQECEADDKYVWSYHGPDNGPKYWDETYPDCGKRDQSPIEIKKRNVLNFYLPQLQYSGFDTPITKATVLNLGWTVLIKPEDNVNRYVTWGINTYPLLGLHFHFGPEGDPGAEHVIDGIRYEMEVHYVTYKENDPNAVAVIAAFMEASDDDNSAFDPITEVLPDVLYRNDSTQLKSEINLADLLPQDPGSFYYYEGSNGIPPCQPGYKWWVLKNIGEVGKDQLDSFMTLYSVKKDDASESCLMGPNYRPVQNLDYRTVFSSK